MFGKLPKQQLMVRLSLYDLICFCKYDVKSARMGLCWFCFSGGLVEWWWFGSGFVVVRWWSGGGVLVWWRGGLVWWRWWVVVVVVVVVVGHC